MRIEIHYKSKKNIDIINNVDNYFEKRGLFYIITRTNNNNSETHIFPINNTIKKFVECKEEKDIYKF